MGKYNLQEKNLASSGGKSLFGGFLLLQFLKGRGTLYEIACVQGAGPAPDFVHNIIYIGSGNFVVLKVGLRRLTLLGDLI